MGQKRNRAAKPPEEPDIWENAPGARPEEGEEEPGSAVENGAGMEFLDNSQPSGPWKDAYTDFFRRD